MDVRERLAGNPRRSALVAACIGLLAVTGQDSGASQDARAHLRLRAARIVEVFDQARVAPAPTGRRRSEMRDGERIAFSVELDRVPSCGDGANASYLFLIDADQSTSTGTVTRAVPELGIEQKVEIRCDSSIRRFVSTVGDVAVRAATAGSPAALEVVVPGDVLPSERFNWVAFAHDGSTATRLPAAGFERWQRLTRWLK